MNPVMTGWLNDNCAAKIDSVFTLPWAIDHPKNSNNTTKNKTASVSLRSLL